MATNILVLNKSWLVTGEGDPEGHQDAPIGSIFLREDGGAGAAFYVKEAGTGNTGWRCFGKSIPAHHASHEPGGLDPIQKLPAHADRHQAGGSDALQVSTAVRLLGRGTGGTGVGPVQEVTIGGGLTMTGTVLSSPRSSVLVNYTYNNATVEPPAAGQVRLDAVYPFTSVTKIWMRTVSADGQDVYWGLMIIEQGMTLLLQDKDDHTLYVRLLVTGSPVDKVTYVEIPVSHTSHGGSINTASQVLMQRSGGGTSLLLARLEELEQRLQRHGL